MKILLLSIILLAAQKWVFRDFMMEQHDDSHGWFPYESTAKEVSEAHAKILLHELCFTHLHGEIVFSWAAKLESECLWRKNYRDVKEYNCFATASGACRVAFLVDDDD